MLELSGVEKTFAGVRALGPISLDVGARRTVALLGPSGCGKSTLLKLVLGLLRPDAGVVRFEGRIVGGAALTAARRRMGYVIQDGGLFPHLTAAGNVSLIARHLGWEPRRIEQRVEALARLVRLPMSVLGRYPAELSGGQRQRTGLMRALMLDPHLLLLDEPLNALDPLVRRDLQNDLRVIFERVGKTVILVTHDVAEAAFFADTIVLMRDGCIAQAGSFDALVRTPADPFVTRFIEAQRSTLPGERSAPGSEHDPSSSAEP
ncbi:MAG: ATP-binding cassette domain-containing protein [Myxococcales bacterium]|jgi:osmoprotectant transport system ATP-binding protein|nr:MAG: ATP-binding cassette domain-containing protein [Myxococcales bacterium]